MLPLPPNELRKWVEGPSDRLYIREWLHQVNPELLEGSDYTCVFYFGKVLSHFGYEESEIGVDDLISMLNVSRHSVIVMDKDVPPERPNEDIRHN